MLWLCIRLPQLPLEALRSTAATGSATACARQPTLEKLALRRLAVWAQQWSSWVSDWPAADERSAAHLPPAQSHALLWLEIGASLKLFSGPAALLATIRQELVPLDYSAEMAVAPTPEAARLLTQVRQPRIVPDLTTLQAHLAPLPLHLLALPMNVITALRSTGLRRIGEVLAVPPATLAQRFGPASCGYLQRLCGTASHPLPAVPFPEIYQGQCEFEAEVATAMALLFPLQRLFGELQGYLRAADRAIQCCRIRLRHRGRDSDIVLHSSQPSRDAAQWLRVAREHLGNLPLPAPVRSLQLEAREFMAPSIQQGDFFDRACDPTQALPAVLDRVQARLGMQAVQQLQVMADYRPERAWRSRTEGADAAENSPPEPGDFPPRPTWLLASPRHIAQPLQWLAGPERIESGWWDHQDVARDYYLTCTPEGVRQWVFQDLRSGAWYLHGLWA
jgi:protein ImuB